MTSAALFYAHRNEPVLRRAARITRLCLEQTPLPDYAGTQLYPSARWGPHLPEDDLNGHGLTVSFSGRFVYNAAAFSGLIGATEDTFDRLLLQRIARDVGVSGVNPQTSRYAHGGMHWVMNFPHLLDLGLDGYRQRVFRRSERATTATERAFCDAMLDVVAGLEALARRCHAKLLEAQADDNSPELAALAAAFGHAPMHPARDFREALAAVHLVTFLGCGEPGRLDQYLYPYYARDVERHELTRAQALSLLDEHVATIDAFVGSPGAWHLTIGGTDAEGNRAYNELTAMCLELNRRYRQPNTSLRVRADMPDQLWDMVLDNLQAGCGNPALINEQLYTDKLTHMAGLSPEDLCDYGFGGCTETLVQGKSAVDSIGSTYNLLDILDAALDTHLLSATCYADFLDAFRDDIRLTVKRLVDEVNARQQCFALHWIDPLRTLLTDDCIERCKGYHDGGCRYNFEITVVYGIANTVNSLYSLTKLFAGKLRVTPAQLLDAMRANYAGQDALLQRIRRLDKFGNSNPDVNDIARDITSFVFNEISQYRCWRGNGRFLPASIGWVDFIAFGKYLGATPDGRLRGEPLADSTGPTQGTDIEGPTATLLSTAAVAQGKALGTCVLNLMLDPASFRSPQQRDKLKALIQTYFAQGGGQLQINVHDAAVLKDAMEHPDRHGNLYVRIAGYNDYFVKQTPEIQTEILERSRHKI